MRKFLFVSFHSVSIHSLVSFQIWHKPKSRRPDGRPVCFFSCPGPNVNRLRRPGAARAQPWVLFCCLFCENSNVRQLFGCGLNTKWTKCQHTVHVLTKTNKRSLIQTTLHFRNLQILLNFSQKSTICSLFQGKSIDLRTYSPPICWASNYSFSLVPWARAYLGKSSAD